MSTLIESLKRLYADKKITLEKIDVLLKDKKITQEQYKHIVNE